MKEYLTSIDIYSMIDPSLVPYILKTFMSLFIALLLFLKLIKPIFYGDKSADKISERVKLISEMNLKKEVELRVIEDHNRRLDDVLFIKSNMSNGDSNYYSLNSNENIFPKIQKMV